MNSPVYPFQESKFQDLHQTRAMTVLRTSQAPRGWSMDVLAEDGNVYHTYLQNSINSSNTSFISALICQFLLEIWKLPHQKLAGVNLNSSLLPPKSMIPSDLKIALARGQILLGYQWLPGQFSFTELQDDTHYWSYKALNNPQDLLKLALFDGWVGNNGRIDRWCLYGKPTARKKIIIYSQHYLDAFGHLAFQDLSMHYRNRAHLRLMELALVQKIKKYQPFDTLHRQLKEYNFACIQRSKEAISTIFDSVRSSYPLAYNHQQKIQDFLFNQDRNQKIFEQFQQLLRS